jgi:predicted nucleotidyltransferase
MRAVAAAGGLAYALNMVPSQTPTLAELRARRDQILALANSHGARNVRVFGSVARGEQTPESDLDLVVDFDAGQSLLDHGELIMDLEEALGCRVDVVSSRGLRERFRHRVLADAVPL